VVDEAIVGMGFTSLWSKYKLPAWLLYPVAYVCDGIGWLIGKKLKLNPFNVTVLTMHRWFRIDAAVQDLDYQPIIAWDAGWKDTIAWFKDNWLPGYHARNESGLVGISNQSQRKIDIQHKGKQS